MQNVMILWQVFLSIISIFSLFITYSATNDSNYKNQFGKNSDITLNILRVLRLSRVNSNLIVVGNPGGVWAVVTVRTMLRGQRTAEQTSKQS